MLEKHPIASLRCLCVSERPHPLFHNVCYFRGMISLALIFFRFMLRLLSRARLLPLVQVSSLTCRIGLLSQLPDVYLASLALAQLVRPSLALAIPCSRHLVTWPMSTWYFCFRGRTTGQVICLVCPSSGPW